MELDCYFERTIYQAVNSKFSFYTYSEHWTLLMEPPLEIDIMVRKKEIFSGTIRTTVRTTAWSQGRKYSVAQLGPQIGLGPHKPIITEVSVYAVSGGSM